MAITAVGMGIGLSGGNNIRKSKNPVTSITIATMIAPMIIQGVKNFPFVIAFA
jgi:hypothetical protein